VRSIGALVVNRGFGPETDIYPNQRNAYFSIINLIGVGVFNFVGDHHRQRDGVLEAEAAKIDDMVEKIRRAAA